jgi:hypothetical protein
MIHVSRRRRSAHRFTSPIPLALAVAAGLSLVPLSVATAQGGPHDGHSGHRRPGAETGSPQAAPARPRRAPSGGHAGHGAGAADTPAVAAFKAAHADMMRGMAVPYTGDPDVDFRIQMIPHHQGAIAMAEVALRHARDPWTRQLAEAVIVEQQREIAEMQAWLSRRGVAGPAAARPQHRITASSYRVHDEEPGTRDEARGQSWAPGPGVPARR